MIGWVAARGASHPRSGRGSPSLVWQIRIHASPGCIVRIQPRGVPSCGVETTGRSNAHQEVLFSIGLCRKTLRILEMRGVYAVGATGGSIALLYSPCLSPEAHGERASLLFSDRSLSPIIWGMSSSTVCDRYTYYQEGMRVESTVWCVPAGVNPERRAASARIGTQVGASRRHALLVSYRLPLAAGSRTYVRRTRRDPLRLIRRRSLATSSLRGDSAMAITTLFPGLRGVMSSTSGSPDGRSYWM